MKVTTTVRVRAGGRADTIYGGLPLLNFFGRFFWHITGARKVSGSTQRSPSPSSIGAELTLELPVAVTSAVAASAVAMTATAPSESSLFGSNVLIPIPSNLEWSAGPLGGRAQTRGDEYALNNTKSCSYLPHVLRFYAMVYHEYCYAILIMLSFIVTNAIRRKTAKWEKGYSINAMGYCWL
jgi:hypothetical protein